MLLVAVVVATRFTSWVHSIHMISNYSIFTYPVMSNNRGLLWSYTCGTFCTTLFTARLHVLENIAMERLTRAARMLIVAHFWMKGKRWKQ